MSVTFAPEVDLLLACARATMRDEDRARAAGAAAAGVDGGRLMALAREHRMVPLLHLHVSRGDVRVEPDIVRDLAALNARVTRRNLRLTARLLHVLDRLDEAGIAAMPLKGPVLAEQVYGSIALRQFGDLDVLVPTGDIDGAVAALIRAGYRRRLTAPAEQDIERRQMHHVGMSSPADGTSVELHRSLISSSSGRGLTLGDAEPWLITMTFAGRRVRAFSRDALVAYLCEHGGGHAWTRIEWMATAAECMRDVEMWDGVFEAAARMGGVARVRAARELFGVLLESPRRGGAGAANALVLAHLAGEPRAHRTTRYQLLTDEGWQARAWRLWAQVGTTHVADATAFGSSLLPGRAYPLARPFRLLIRTIRATGSRMS